MFVPEKRRTVWPWLEHPNGGTAERLCVCPVLSVRSVVKIPDQCSKSVRRLSLIRLVKLASATVIVSSTISGSPRCARTA